METRDSRSVVAAGGDGLVSGIKLGADDFDLTQQASLLKVAVRDGAGRVVGRDELSLDFCSEGLSPHIGFTRRVEEDTPHSSLGSVSGTHERWLFGDNLGKASRSVAETGGKVGECLDVHAKLSGHTNAVGRSGVVEHLLEGAK